MLEHSQAWCMLCTCGGGSVRTNAKALLHRAHDPAYIPYGQLTDVLFMYDLNC